MNKIGLLLSICCFMAIVSRSANADLLNKLKGTSNDLISKVNNICLLDDNCNKDFSTINNYCCSGQCCNFVQYIFRNE